MTDLATSVGIAGVTDADRGGMTVRVGRVAMTGTIVRVAMTVQLEDATIVRVAMTVRVVGVAMTAPIVMIVLGVMIGRVVMTAPIVMIVLGVMIGRVVTIVLGETIVLIGPVDAETGDRIAADRGTTRVLIVARRIGGPMIGVATIGAGMIEAGMIAVRHVAMSHHGPVWRPRPMSRPFRRASIPASCIVRFAPSCEACPRTSLRSSPRTWSLPAS